MNTAELSVSPCIAVSYGESVVNCFRWYFKSLFYVKNSHLYSNFSSYSVFCVAYGVLSALASLSATEKILDERN